MTSISILGSSPPGTDDPEEVEDDADLCVGFDPEEDMDEEEENIDVCDNGGTQDEDTNQFDEIVGCLAEVLMDSDFVAVKDAFCRSNCSHFESSGENKLIYTQLFDQYGHLLETEINARLLRILPTFSMPHFLALLTTRHEQLDPEMSNLLESRNRPASILSCITHLNTSRTERTAPVIACGPATQLTPAHPQPVLPSIPAGWSPPSPTPKSWQQPPESFAKVNTS
ncbi:MAG: hypothetical protein WDW38_000043 [Sanguina aurantia]